MLVVALTDVQAAERPEMAEMELSEDLAIAKLGISKYLRQEPVNHTVQLSARHTLFSLSGGARHLAVAFLQTDTYPVSMDCIISADFKNQLLLVPTLSLADDVRASHPNR